jgi:hypothetical protein
LQYNVRYQTVEAQQVVLAGKPLMAFLAGGDMHLVSADAFSLFFVPEGGLLPAPAAPVTAPLVMSPVPAPVEKKPKEKVRTGRPRKSDPPRDKPEPQPRPTGIVMIDGMYPESISHATFLAIREAPRTKAEVCDRVIAAFPAASRGTIDGYISQLVVGGRVERRDDPNTQLTKLHLKAEK